MFEVERGGKLVLFPNMFRIGAFEIIQEPNGSAMCSVCVHVDGGKVTFEHFRGKPEAKLWVEQNFRQTEPDLPELAPEPPIDPFAKKKKGK